MYAIYFDAAAVPAVVTPDRAYRPARDSLSWEIRDFATGDLIARYDPPAAPIPHLSLRTALTRSRGFSPLRLLAA